MGLGAAALAQQPKKVQQQLRQGEVDNKSDHSPVTVADYGAQALVAWKLESADPGFSMVGEENADTLREAKGAGMAERITQLVNAVLHEEEPNAAAPLSAGQVLDLIDHGSSEGGAEGRHWVLDPIDGTRGFMGQRQYAVCLGLLAGGKAVLGVLGCPNLPHGRLRVEDGGAGAAAWGEGHQGEVGVLFAATRGGGAHAGPLTGVDAPGQRLALQDVTDASSVRFMESYESGHSDFSFSGRLAQKLGITLPPLRLDSQAKYGALARGDAGINLRFPRAGYREKIWDHAAGAVIVEEAGAVITDASGAPLDFGRGRWLDLDRGIVTSTPTMHARLLRAIAELAEEGVAAS